MTGSTTPILFDAQAVAETDSVVIFVPGALAPIHIFDPAQHWEEKGYALAYFRLPGLDGLPLDHNLVIDNAARQVAEFVNEHPDKSFRLFGYSTGGAIVLDATKYIQVSDLKVAALSPAVSKSGGLTTVLKSGSDILAASTRAGSVNREKVWLEYYRTLLFGREGLKDPKLTADIDRLVEQEKDRIVFPTPKISRSHTRDIRRWRASPVPLDDSDIAFFVGMDDPVFSLKQTYELAQEVGVTRVTEYENGGHLLFVTHPEVFDDVLEFFEEK